MSLGSAVEWETRTPLLIRLPPPLQTRMGLGVGVPPRKGIPGRRCCPVATSLMFSPWVRGSAVGLVFRRGSGVPPLGAVFRRWVGVPGEAHRALR